jgi:DNA-directed RNA polymerase specialized sigma24 family protein
VAGLVEIRVTEELLSRARRGEEAARAELYELFAAATFGLIRRLLGARALAEDVFQETMLTFFEQLAAFRGEAPLGAWLRRIAVSKCLMCLRSPWQRARLDFGAFAEEGAGVLLPLLVTPGPLPESLDLERALARLSPTARAVVWLFEVEGYSHEEIARAFDRSVSFSKSQLSRAHQRLREWLEPASERQTCTPT